VVGLCRNLTVKFKDLKIRRMQPAEAAQQKADWTKSAEVAGKNRISIYFEIFTS